MKKTLCMILGMSIYDEPLGSRSTWDEATATADDSRRRNRKCLECGFDRSTGDEERFVLREHVVVYDHIALRAQGEPEKELRRPALVRVDANASRDVLAVVAKDVVSSSTR